MLIVRENASAYEKKVLATEPVVSARDIFELLRDRLGREDVEVMVMVALDNASHVVHLSEVARGSTSACTASCQVVLRAALVAGGTRFILVHNHPSGDPTPSPDDVVMTRRLAKAADLVGCPMLDHVIIAGMSKFVSMLELGFISTEE